MPERDSCPRNHEFLFQQQVIDVLLQTVHGVDLRDTAIEEFLNLTVGEQQGVMVLWKTIGQRAIFDNAADSQRAAAAFFFIGRA